MLRKYGISVDLNLYSVFDQLPQGVTIQDKTGNLVYCNIQAAELVGFDSPKKFLKAPIKDVLEGFYLLTQSGKPLSFAELPGRKALVSGKTEQATVRFIVKKTGLESWTRIKSQPLFDTDKNISGVINIFDDLTAIKKRETEYKFIAQASAVMAESLSYEARLESFAHLVVPSFADWCTIDILDQNNNAVRMATVHPDPKRIALAKKLWTHYPPNRKSAGSFHQLLKRGEIQLYENITDEMLRASAVDDQHLSWLRELNLKSVAIVPLIARGKKLGLLSFGTSDSGRKITQDDIPFLSKLADRVAMLADNARLYSALTREIQKQRIIRNELEKSEEKFSSIFHNSYLGMVIFDNDGLISEVNEAAGAMLQVVPQKLTKKSIAQLINPSEPHQFTSLWHKMNPHTIKHGELEWSNDKNEVKTFQYTITSQIVPYLNLLLLRDVTDAKIEQKRREHFLAITGHELKSPLASIKAISQLLKKQLKKVDDKKVIYLEQVTENVDVLTRLVNDLLDVTRIRQGKLEFLYEVVDVTALIKKIVEEISYTVKGWDIEIVGEIKKEVITDRGRLSQVIHNLIRNGIKYASQNKHLVVSLSDQKNKYHISIKDFGSGIAAAEQRKIFRLYYRSTQSQHQSGKGLGVGLYISTEIIKQMGGKIGVESKLGEGSTFYFDLPYIPKKPNQK